VPPNKPGGRGGAKAKTKTAPGTTVPPNPGKAKAKKPGAKKSKAKPAGGAGTAAPKTSKTKPVPKPVSLSRNKIIAAAQKHMKPHELAMLDHLQKKASTGVKLEHTKHAGRILLRALVMTTALSIGIASGSPLMVGIMAHHTLDHFRGHTHMLKFAWRALKGQKDLHSDNEPDAHQTGVDAIFKQVQATMKRLHEDKERNHGNKIQLASLTKQEEALKTVIDHLQEQKDKYDSLHKKNDDDNRHSGGLEDILKQHFSKHHP
jgi:hypothetical protein